MKIMLIQLPHFYDDDYRKPSSYPLGIGYLASILKKHHDVVPMDLWIDNVTVDKALSRIRKNIPDVFCISVYSTQYPYFKQLVTALKNEFPHKKIIAGGPGATFSYTVFLEKTDVNYCVIGEGEITLKELLDAMDHPHDVKGIAYKKNGAVIVNPQQEQIRDIDTLPLPDRNFFDIERYSTNAQNEVGGLLHGYRNANMLAGRGCPYSCTYCSKTFSGIRVRSIEKIAEEITMLKNTYSINAITFNDELVIMQKKRTLALCDALKKINITWGCQGRINLVDEETLTAMKESGCEYIGYGVESYTQSILDTMKKQIRVESIVPVIEMTRRIGLKPIVQYMYGFPGENDESIQQTIKFFKKIDHPYVGFTTTPIPGTELYEQAKKRNLITDEEAYLIRLTGGYNMMGGLVNLTEFSDEDFIAKKKYVMKAVNYIYYKKHPLRYVKVKVKRYIRFIRMFIFEPLLFWKKVIKKIHILQKRLLPSRIFS